MLAQTLLAAIVACTSVASAAPVAAEAYGPPINPHIPEVGSKRDTVEAYGPPLNPHIPAVESKRDGVEAYGPPQTLISSRKRTPSKLMVLLPTLTLSLRRIQLKPMDLL
ncbi:hypothetical protein Ct61P_12748 [Colletotrichum tofieldiae]|nr:hypothetical protein Ct61P_12748 [Colletotrichum tofieldiae]